jgi:hypothetical protein
MSNIHDMISALHEEFRSDTAKYSMDEVTELQFMAAEITNCLTSSHPQEIIPSTANTICMTFLDAGLAAVGLEETGAFLGAMEGIDGDLLAAIIENLPLTEETGRANRKLALDTADQLSPEKAQSLYHLAVLITKLV